MRAKYGLRIAALALLSFLAVLSPHQAWADPATIANQCNGTTFNDNVANNRSAHQQNLFNQAHNINTQFPITQAMNQCIQNIMNIFAKLPGLADPMNIAAAIINPLLMQIVNQVCSQVMAEINSVKSALMNMTKICVPLPKFNMKLDLPTFSSKACSSGTSISLLTPNTTTPGTPAPAPTSYGYTQFQRQ